MSLSLELPTNRSTWVARWLRGMILALGFCWCTLHPSWIPSCFGQEGFDDVADFADDQGANGKPKSQANQSGASNLPPSSHPLVRDLRANPPQTPSEFARAVLYMSRISHWADFHQLMDQRMAMQLDESRALAMVDEIGSDQWLRISLKVDQLTAKEAEWISSLLEKASASNRKPKMLEQHVTNLRSPDAASQSRGFKGIQAAGHPGLGYLIQSILRQKEMPSSAAQKTVVSFGIAGEEALKAAWMIEDAAARERLASLAAAFPQQPNEILLSVWFSSNDTDGAKRVAATSPTRPRSAEEVSKSLEARLRKNLEDLKRARHVDFPQPREVWSLDAKGRLTTHMGDEIDHALQRAWQDSRNLLRQVERSESQTALAIAATLEAQYYLAPSVETQDPLGWVGSNWNAGLGKDGVSLANAWQAAVAHQLTGAQLRLVQQMGALAKHGDAAEGYMVQALSEASKSHFPSVRYASAQAMAPFLLTQEYGKAHRTIEVLVEMLGLEGSPMALVIGANRGLCDHFTQLLSQAGVRSKVANSGREALQWIQQPNPIEHIYVVDRVSDVSLSQLLQRLRAYPKTASIPLALLIDGTTDSENQFVVELPGIVRSYVPPDLQGTLTILQDMERRETGPRMSSADRVAWKSVAETFFRSHAKLPSSQQHPSMERYVAMIASRIPGTLLSEAGADELSVLDSKDGQLELVRRIARSSASLEDRQKAATEFANSIQRAGLKLTTEEVKGLYQAYNAEGRTNLELRQFLGQLLDLVDSSLQP